MITAEIARSILDYNPVTGELTWKKRTADSFPCGGERAKAQAGRHNKLRAGKPAFTAIVKGYRWGGLCGKKYSAHRVIWLMVYGQWPQFTIDHINGNPLDNRLENLRDVPHQVNGRNTRTGTRNSSGYLGVHWKRQRNRWCACARLNGKTIYFGTFKKFDDAVAARKAGIKRLGFHENHGRPNVS